MEANLYFQIEDPEKENFWNTESCIKVYISLPNRKTSSIYMKMQREFNQNDNNVIKCDRYFISIQFQLPYFDMNSSFDTYPIHP